jgi:hypothetical protein
MRRTPVLSQKSHHICSMTAMPPVMKATMTHPTTTQDDGFPFRYACPPREYCALRGLVTVSFMPHGFPAGPVSFRRAQAGSRKTRGLRRARERADGTIGTPRRPRERSVS